MRIMTFLILMANSLAGCKIEGNSGIAQPVATRHAEKRMIVKFYRTPVLEIPIRERMATLRQAVAFAKDQGGYNEVSRYLLNDSSFLKDLGIREDEKGLLGDEIVGEEEILVLIRGNQRFFVPAIVVSNSAFGRFPVQANDILLSFPNSILMPADASGNRNPFWDSEVGKMKSIEYINAASGTVFSVSTESDECETITRELPEKMYFEEGHGVDALFIVRQTGRFLDQIIIPANNQYFGSMIGANTFQRSVPANLLDGDSILLSRFERHPQVAIALGSFAISK